MDTTPAAYVDALEKGLPNQSRQIANLIKPASPIRSKEYALKTATLSALVIAISVATMLEAPSSYAAFKQLSQSRKCVSGSRTNCVVDGDTIWIADIDTPEISEPKCRSELALGNKATARLVELINAGPFELLAWPGRDEDRYGRKLRVLVRNGQSLGDMLVAEGLARTWNGRREPWC